MYRTIISNIAYAMCPVINGFQEQAPVQPRDKYFGSAVNLFVWANSLYVGAYSKKLNAVLPRIAVTVNT